MMNFLFGYTLFRHVRALQFFFALAILTLSSAYAAIPIQSWTTPNGAKVLLVENHSIPVVDVSVEFDAGSRRDPTDKAGLASMANMMLARGIAASSGVGGDEPALSEAQVLDAFADTAAQRGGSVSLDRAGGG